MEIVLAANLIEKVVTFDKLVFEYVLANRSDQGLKLFYYVTRCGDPLILMTVFFSVILVLVLKRQYAQVSVLAVVFMLSWVGMQLLKSVLRRNRPIGAELLFQVSGFSFPSGHAMVSLSFYGIILFIICSYINKKYHLYIYAIGYVFIFLIGVSRIYLGVHYLSDVLAGFILGSLPLLLGIKILKIVLNQEKT